MSARPSSYIVTGSPASAPVPPGSTAVPIEQVPAVPFGLAGLHLAVLATVQDHDDAAAVLLAAARGATTVVRITAEPAIAESFLDDLARLAEVRPAPPAPTLDADHMALLSELADGVSLVAAGVKLGLSRRTAARRLAEARLRLGASTTTEALRVFSRADPR